MSIVKISGVVQNYAWGGTKFIPDLLGIDATEVPYAEYWMGAHEKAPSKINWTGQSLTDFIKENPESFLGEEVSRRFGRLPFLFKVLDVREMLSIQVHPDKQNAVKGFEVENSLGVPLDAPNRNYKDDNHKPEVMVALGDFWLLHGFKQRDELIQTLHAVPELHLLISVFEEEGYKGLYKSIMVESSEQTNSTLQPLINRIMPLFLAGKLDKSLPDYWAAKAYQSFYDGKNIDKGIYSIYLFNIVHLMEGEGIFQDAGIPHAYMEGQCVELMANSDNVLRGGLTAKYVDVPELLKHIHFEETIPCVLTGELNPNERIYGTPALDFELSKISLSTKSEYNFKTQACEILLVTEGCVNVRNGENILRVKRGEVVAIPTNVEYHLSCERGELFKATCPI